MKPPTPAQTLSYTASKSPEAFAARITSGLIRQFKNTPAESWLKYMATYLRRTYKPWIEMYIQDPGEALACAELAARALNNLPKADEPLMSISEFAQSIGRDKRDFAVSSLQGQLFLRALAHRFGVAVPINAADCSHLLLRAGFFDGSMVAPVLVRGLLPESYDGGEFYPSKYFNSLPQAHMLTLENLSLVRSVGCIGGRVFVVENPYVFAVICDSLKHCNFTIICPNGGHGPAFLHLLRLINKTEAHMYFSGDMTYNTLAMADKLYLEFGKNFVPWRYEKSDYEEILSGNVYHLPAERKPTPLHCEPLASLLSLIRKTGKTASSATLTKHLISDIGEFCDTINYVAQ